MLRNFAVYDVRHDLVPQQRTWAGLPVDNCPIVRTITVVWDPEAAVDLQKTNKFWMCWVDLAKPIHWPSNKLTLIGEADAWWLIDNGFWERVGSLRGKARSNLWEKFVWETRLLG